MYEEIGRKIRKLRNQHGMSTEDLGERIGYSGSYVSYMERGKRPISLEILNHIADIFNVDIKYFFGDGVTEFDLSEDEKAWIYYHKKLEEEGITLDDVREWVEIAKSIRKNRK